jgi:hypothetical protein
VRELFRSARLSSKDPVHPYRADVTTVPTWAAISVSIGTPVLTFLGVLLAQFLTRKSATELEVRSKREETMRNLRWAAELAVSGDPTQAKLGVSQLVALGDSDLLDDAQQLFIDAALSAVVEDPADEIGDDADVEVVRELPQRGQPEETEVRSDQEDLGEGGEDD